MAAQRDVQLPPQVYVDPRPAEYFSRFHEYARTHEPDWVYAAVKHISNPYVSFVFRLKAQDTGNVPERCPVILAPNHFSAMDHWFIGIRLWPRRVRFMAKSQLFKGRLREYILPHGGAFPVRRGQRDEESIRTALTILDKGGVLVIYPEGGRSRSGRLGSTARPGIGRLALESGAPVVPVAVHGSEKARNWRRLRFPSITVTYGESLTFATESDPSRERQQQVADEIFGAVRSLHAAGTARDAR
jgi:1-acyl-sn-glycerol-3-phosphate acyltransferase